MKYLTLILAAAKIIEPLISIYNQAVAEGKSSDPTITKIKVILDDAEKVIQDLLEAL